MKNWQLAGSTAFAALLIGLVPASAQVTPEDVWQNWQDMGAAYGQTIKSDAATRDGDTLRVSGAVMTMEDGAGGKVEAEFGDINFRDLGDGTVEMTMADSYPIEMVMPATEEGTGPTNLTMTVSQPGMKLIAGGSPTETSYAVTAPTVNIKIDEVEGVDAAVVDLTADVTMTVVEGTYLVAGEAGAKTVDSKFSAQSLSMVVKAKDPEEGSDVSVVANIADLSGATKGTFLGMAEMANMAQALNSGMTAEGSFSYGQTSLDMDVVEATGPTKIVATAASGNINFAFDKARMLYAAGGTGAEVTISGPDIPFPEVKVTYAEALFNLLMPVSKSDTPQDFAFTTKIVDFAISDDIWGMFDPAGSLPHDPATLIIDTKGKARLTVDLMDEEATAALGDAPPGELHALDLTELKLKIAGAELTGSGAATFDNTDLTTFQGMPAPTGKVDLKLVGGNTLLDKLIAMGLIPEEQAMGIRMMSGMFATVGEGEDTLTSTLEFKEKGFFANGQRLY